MKATFDHSVDVLAKAFFNGTLKHGSLCACAVGNLIADACGIKMIKDEKAYWGINWENAQPDWFPKNKNNPQILSAGYSADQIFEIEKAFESVDYRYDTDGFFGMMAVVEILAKIHGVDLEVANTAKLKFSRA